MSILNDIKGLFLPPVCPVCGGELHEGEGAFCMMCRTLAPQTGFWRRADNPLAERLRNEFPVVQASAFLWFVAGSPWQRAIHGFKYYNRWRTARDLGAWYGGNLADSGLYGSVDCIVPVPLHTRRLLARGYNQAAYIAEGIASRMGVPVEDRAVSRLRNNPSQTTRSSAGRWENVRDLFAVARPGALAGRHVLLVDDVVTTGSTLLSCTKLSFVRCPTVGSALLHWPFRAAISDWIGNFDRVVFALTMRCFGWILLRPGPNGFGLSLTFRYLCRR